MKFALYLSYFFIALALSGCAKTCDDLSAEMREKSAEGMHVAVDAYADGASAEKMASKVSGVQQDLIDLRGEMVSKNCPLTM